MDTPPYSTLAAALAALPDPRHARGKRYAWCSLYPWWIILPSASAPLTIRITLRILPEHLPYREIIG